MGDDKSPTSQQSKADELEERLIDFAVRIVNLSASLPRTPAGKHIAGQIMRSGTSPAPNYGEARRCGKPCRFHSQITNRSEGVE